MDEKQLRVALREHPDCPALEILSADLTGSSGTEARALAELHLARCLHCRTELDLLREFEAGTIRPGEAAAVGWISKRLNKPRNDAPVPVNRPRMTWRMPKFIFAFAGIAIAALLAVGISSEWRLRQLATRPVPEFGSDVRRARAVEVIPTPGFFEWKPVPGAARYYLEARTVNGSVIFHNTFTGTSLAFPAQVDALVKAGKLVEWEVIAKDPAGATVAGSGAQDLRGDKPSAQ